MAGLNRISLPAQAAHQHFDLVSCIGGERQLGQLLGATFEHLFGGWLPDRAFISHARNPSRWVRMVWRSVSTGSASLPGTSASPSNGASKRRAWTSAVCARVESPLSTYARARANCAN